MSRSLAEELRIQRTNKHMSQQQLADKLFVERSTVASWETGRRVPDAVFLARISRCLDIDAAILLNAALEDEETPNIILVDDEKIVLTGELRLLEANLTNARIVGFQKPSEAIAFAKENRVDIAFLDIELGTTNGFAIAKELLSISALTNIIFLTAYADYSLKAWETEACGFIVKPLSSEELKSRLLKLRHPVPGGPLFNE